MKKQIMRRAWELAKEGHKVYGGSARLYFSESLRIAWKESRMDIDTAMRITVKNDKGSVELNKEQDRWYVTYKGQPTSNFYTAGDLKKMIANGGIYGQITYA